jgi:hypothetical protein
MEMKVVGVVDRRIRRDSEVTRTSDKSGAFLMAEYFPLGRMEHYHGISLFFGDSYGNYNIRRTE